MSIYPYKFDPSCGFNLDSGSTPKPIELSGQWDPTTLHGHINQLRTDHFYTNCDSEAIICTLEKPTYKYSTRTKSRIKRQLKILITLADNHSKLNNYFCNHFKNFPVKAFANSDLKWAFDSYANILESQNEVITSLLLKTIEKTDALVKAHAASLNKNDPQSLKKLQALFESCIQAHNEEKKSSEALQEETSKLYESYNAATNQSDI